MVDDLYVSMTSAIARRHFVIADSSTLRRLSLPGVDDLTVSGCASYQCAIVSEVKIRATRLLS